MPLITMVLKRKDFQEELAGQDPILKLTAVEALSLVSRDVGVSMLQSEMMRSLELVEMTLFWFPPLGINFTWEILLDTSVSAKII